MNAFGVALRRVRGTPIVGIGISRGEVRFVGVNHAGVLVWNRSLARGRDTASLAEIIGKGLAERPPSLRGRVRMACAVGPAEAQLRPLYGLPQLRSFAEQAAVVSASIDRFFVSEGAPLRVSSPMGGRDGTVWVAAVQGDVIQLIAEACRAQRVELIGVAPVAAALAHLAAVSDRRDADGAPCIARVARSDDGTRLHVEYDADRRPIAIRRERAGSGLPALEGDIGLPERVSQYLGDAYAATLLHERDPFVIGEHSDDTRHARLVRRRTMLWHGLAVASVLAAAWLPATLAIRRADRAGARLAALGKGQHELRQVEASLAASTTTLNTIAAFERSRRSATLLLAELAMALPESTAVTTLHTDSVGGALTVLAPRAAGALEAVSHIPLVSRAQVTGAVTREMTNGVELERASLRFVFRRPEPRVSGRDSVARLAMTAPRSVTP